MDEVNPYQATRLMSNERRGSDRPLYQSDQLRFEIGKQATNAVISGVLAFFIPLFVPVALLCGARAISLMEQNGSDQTFIRRAQLGRALACIAALLYAAIVTLLLFSP